MEVGGLNVGLPPQHPQDLLLQHSLHLHPSLQLLQLLTDIKALNLLIGALHLLQCCLTGDSWAARASVSCQAVALQVKPQAAQMYVVALAVGAFVWTLAGVQALVQLEVNKLGELGWAEFAMVRLLP